MRRFTIHKGGKLVEVEFVGSDRFTRQDVFEPLHRDRVVGVDTESLTVGGELDTVLLPLYFSTGPELTDVTGRSALELMLDAVCERYSVPEPHPSRTEQRYQRGGRRDGRRETIDPVLLVFFNLPYDIGRLCTRTPQLLRALASGADTYTVAVGRRSVEVCRMVLGAGSSLEWLVRERDPDGERRITRLLGIDMHGYWKGSLAASAKALGVSEKLDIPQEWYRRPREEFEEEEWETFRRYAVGDVQSTSELYHATVDLLRTVDARVVRRTGVIPPSAPGAAARIAFAKSHDGGVDSWRRYPAWADQMGCDAYRGARAFCARPGRHTGLVVRDIKSAYPYVLTQLPDPVTVRCERVNPGLAGIRDLRGKFGVLRIDGEGLDPVYPALRTHDEERGRLRGVYGRFENLAVTIPEVMVGLADESLRVTAVRDGVVMRGDPERSFLRRAMLDFFAIKDDPANAKPLRDTGKLLAVSTYGKLVEAQCDQYWLDSGVMCPPFEDLVGVAQELARVYAETPAEEFDDRAAWLIERCGSHLVGCRDVLCRGCGPESLARGEPVAVPLRVRFLSVRRYRAGQYFMPLYAAQVTGLTSAALGAMARATAAMQGDTDSVHAEVASTGRGFYDAMARAGYGWPTAGLGSWSLETPHPSEESWCARVKLYSHRFADGTFLRCPACGAEPGASCRSGTQCADRPYKQAVHGFAKYPGGCQALHAAIRDVAEGRSHRYITKAAPRKIREALVRGLPVGEFVSREVSVMAGLDPNLEIKDGVCHWKSL